MKPLIAAGIALLLTTGNGIATENTLQEAPVEKPPLDTTESASKPVRGEDESGQEKADEWKPRFVVTLQTSEDEQGFRGVHASKTQTLEVPYTAKVYVDRKHADGKIQRMAVLKRSTEMRAVVVQSALPSRLYCDEIDVRLGNPDNAGSELDCPGKLHLFVGGMQITAESGSLKNGQLRLTNAEIRQAGTTATAESLALAMPLFGVSTTIFNRAVPGTASSPPFAVPHIIFLDDDGVLKPEPDRFFDPEAGFPRQESEAPKTSGFDTFDEAAGAPAVPMDPLPTIIR